MQRFESLSARVDAGVERLLGGISAETVFGTPLEVGEKVVLRAVSIERMGGFGFGGGFDETMEGAGGGGGGGGGRAEGRPVAVVEIDPTGVRVRPILDVTRIGVTAAMVLLALVRRRRRG